MPKNRKDIVSCLQKKGFRPADSSHHDRFVYHTMDGKVTKIRTYTSRSGKDVDDNILSQMAKQCKLTNKKFLEFLECSLSQQEFEEAVKEHL
jgi:hypothetical protein